ncbi:hypothetical protein K501DRAFT_270632 [Backusella circina FSU 941]|nr:hypothetical protein K501DRAFT_270632 [Backusella circina FSU 941]
MLDKLPNEILHSIVSNVSYQEMNELRQTSRLLRKFCDCSIYWKNLELVLKENKFWKLSFLNSILSPHIGDVKSIEIRGVHDSVIRYLLLKCINLQYLTIHGWNTLSDHSLRLYSQQNTSLVKFSLFGTPNKSNYISVNADTLGKLMIQSPNITHILILCQIHIHAESLISLLEGANKLLALESFTIASSRTWHKEHIIRLNYICPNIQRVCLLPGAANAGISSESHFERWLHEQTETLSSDISLVTEDDCIIFAKSA